MTAPFERVQPSCARGENARLTRLARAWGIETSGVERPEIVLAVLRALGAPVHTTADVDEAWRATRERWWSAIAPPVVVSWDAAPIALSLRLPSVCAGQPVRVTAREDGADARSFDALATDVRSASVGGETFVLRRVTLPAFATYGAHALDFEVGSHRASVRVLAAPLRPTAIDGARTWGVFLPLHALRTRGDWGCGDLGGLAELVRWSASRGARFVGTLPIDSVLPEALECPYTPSSRRFWNELFVDVERVPELAASPRARARIGSQEFQRELASLRASRLVDYARVAAAKCDVLRELHRSLNDGPSARAAEFAAFRREHPEVEDHARFRAALERESRAWRAWPAAQRDGVLRDGDFDPECAGYHAYAQWIASEQVDAVARASRESGAELYLDLPIGVHPDGYDVWRERGEFLEGLSIGAPPDAFMRDGQDWGLPPPHPLNVRANGYGYFAECLRHHLRAAKRLRIDHVMGLHHLFVIPHGAPAAQGVYVRYRAEELHAVLALEARRARATVVGEDLGTVPASVRDAMDRHGLQRMYVLPFELDASGEGSLAEPRADSLASLGTHDTPTFHGYWSGAGGHGALVASAERELANERWRRALLHALALALCGDPPSPAETSLADGALERALAFLAASRARGVLVNLEDLWLEPEQQNHPGTTGECANWRRKSRFAMEEIEGSERVATLLRSVDRLRSSRS